MESPGSRITRIDRRIRYTEPVTTSPVTLGRYRLLERLAQGGMAEVFRAKSLGVEGFEKVLVVKRLLPTLAVDPEFVEMFVNEAKIAISLSHANVVQVFDIGQIEGSYFIAMEYVDGLDLATLLSRGSRRQKSLPVALAVYIAGEVAKALDYAHRRRTADQELLQVVHRDVSPQNILLSKEGEVKLADFGIARAWHEAKRPTLGKYAYMSPEQASGEPVDGRSDLFSLGVVLYECLSGIQPFEAGSKAETLARVRSCDYSRLRRAAPHISRALCDAVDRALARHPEDRHPNAGRFFEALARSLHSTGQRVSPADLATYIESVGDAGGRRGARVGSIRRPFFDDAGAVVHRGPAATPLEIPTSTSTGARRGSSSVRDDNPARRPQAERRDCTVVAIGPSDSPTLPAEIAAAAERFGGLALHDRPMAGWWHFAFGLRDPDGLDTDAAIRFFLTLRRSMLSGESSIPSHQAGVHGGRALVGADGTLVRDARLTELVQAATTAAELAQPGQGLATSEVERASRRGFEFRRVQGTDRWAIVQERSRIDALGAFFGRVEPLRRFTSLVVDASKATPKVIAIVGDAGVGKTRFLLEAIRRLELGDQEVGVHAASLCAPGREVPFSALRDMLRVILGIQTLDPESVARDKVARLRELGLSTVERAALKALLGAGSQDDVATAPGPPIGSAIASMVHQLAQDRPTIFAYDAAEHADRQSLELLHRLVAGTHLPNAIVVLVHRPDVLTEWSTLPNYHAIAIEPLDRDETQALIEARLGSSSVPESLLGEMLRKGRGNPLYVGEYSRALQDAGVVEMSVDGCLLCSSSVDAVEVPKRLRGMLAARLSRLRPEVRHLIQVAAVIGAPFHTDLIAETIDQPVDHIRPKLAELQAANLLERHAPDQCALRTELIGEVVRDGLTLESRKGLHIAIAEAHEIVYGAQIDDWTERIAHHFQEGGDRIRAAAYLVRTANHLELEGALVAAIEHLERALDMTALSVTADRFLRLELYERLGRLSVRAHCGERGAARMISALDVADGLGRDDFAARFCMLRGELLAQAYRIEESREWLERARHTAKRNSGRDLLRDVMIAAAEVEARVGNFRRAIGPLEDAHAMSRSSADSAASLRCLVPLAIAHAGGGHADLAHRCLSELHSLANDQADPFLRCRVAHAEMLVHFHLDDREDAARVAARTLELAKEHRIASMMAEAAYCAGETHLRLGDCEKAFAMLQYSLEVGRDAGLISMQHRSRRTLAFVDLSRRASSEGRRTIEDACDYAARQGHTGDLIQGRYLLAHADYLLDRRDRARGGFEEVARLAEGAGNGFYAHATSEALRALAEGRAVTLPN